MNPNKIAKTQPDFFDHLREATRRLPCLTPGELWEVASLMNDIVPNITVRTQWDDWADQNIAEYMVGGFRKIAMIKRLRDVSYLPLKESKDVVEAAEKRYNHLKDMGL